MTLTVSENRRFLVCENNAPFFYLGDTAWELFHRLTREEIKHYLETRKTQGFTVIQAVCLAEFDGLFEPNRDGHLPLFDNDPARPNPAYFEIVDFAVDYAAQKGLFIGMLPTWGDKVNKSWGIGPEIFTPDNAFVYGQFLGNRYKNAPVLWINGGDREVKTPEQAEIWRQIARGLQLGDNNAHLVTFHPQGGQASSAIFHNEPWLDFNMVQSGHNRREKTNDVMIAADYARPPIKPCMDGEPCYENHPIDFDAKNGRFSTREVRAAAYRAVFAGAHGHTYGCHDVWQFFDAARHAPVTFANTPWRDALLFPAATQMQHLKNLLLSRPYLKRVPAPDLVRQTEPLGSRLRTAYATAGENAAYAFVYTVNGVPFTVNLSHFAQNNVADLRAWWFDPRTGACREAETVAVSGVTHEFTPPLSDTGSDDETDWVLVLDDKAANFSRPGEVITA